MFEMSQETFERLYHRCKITPTPVASVKVGDVIVAGDHDMFVEVAFVDTTSEPGYIKILDELRNGTVYPANTKSYIAVVTNFNDIY